MDAKCVVAQLPVPRPVTLQSKDLQSMLERLFNVALVVLLATQPTLRFAILASINSL